jgi:hypothetical protein
MKNIDNDNMLTLIEDAINSNNVIKLYPIIKNSNLDKNTANFKYLLEKALQQGHLSIANILIKYFNSEIMIDFYQGFADKDILDYIIKTNNIQMRMSYGDFGLLLNKGIDLDIIKNLLISNKALKFNTENDFEYNPLIELLKLFNSSTEDQDKINNLIELLLVSDFTNLNTLDKQDFTAISMIFFNKNWNLFHQLINRPGTKQHERDMLYSAISYDDFAILLENNVHLDVIQYLIGSKQLLKQRETNNSNKNPLVNLIQRLPNNREEKNQINHIIELFLESNFKNLNTITKYSHSTALTAALEFKQFWLANILLERTGTEITDLDLFYTACYVEEIFNKVFSIYAKDNALSLQKKIEQKIEKNKLNELLLIFKHPDISSYNLDPYILIAKALEKDRTDLIKGISSAFYVEYVFEEIKNIKNYHQLLKINQIRIKYTTLDYNSFAFVFQNNIDNLDLLKYILIPGEVKKIENNSPSIEFSESPLSYIIPRIGSNPKYNTLAELLLDSDFKNLNRYYRLLSTVQKAIIYQRWTILDRLLNRPDTIIYPADIVFASTFNSKVFYKLISHFYKDKFYLTHSMQSDNYYLSDALEKMKYDPSNNLLRSITTQLNGLSHIQPFSNHINIDLNPLNNFAPNLNPVLPIPFGFNAHNQNQLKEKRIIFDLNYDIFLTFKLSVRNLKYEFLNLGEYINSMEDKINKHSQLIPNNNLDLEVRDFLSRKTIAGLFFEPNIFNAGEQIIKVSENLSLELDEYMNLILKKFSEIPKNLLGIIMSFLNLKEMAIFSGVFLKADELKQIFPYFVAYNGYVRDKYYIPINNMQTIANPQIASPVVYKIANFIPELEFTVKEFCIEDVKVETIEQSSLPTFPQVIYTSNMIVDAVKLSFIPSFEHAKQLTYSASTVYSIVQGSSLYSYAIMGAEFTEKAIAGNYKEAAIDLTAKLAVITAISNIGSIGSAALTGYSLYKLLENSDKFLSKINSNEGQIESLQTWGAIYQAFANSPLQYIYDFETRADELFAKAITIDTTLDFENTYFGM